MAPEFVGSIGQSAFGTSSWVLTDAYMSPQPGDLRLMFFGIQAATITPPPGEDWMLLGEDREGRIIGWQVWGQWFPEGGAGDQVFSIGSNVYWAIVAGMVRGADPDAPLDVAPIGPPLGSGTSLANPSLTPTQPDTLRVDFASVYHATAADVQTIGMPAGQTSPGVWKPTRTVGYTASLGHEVVTDESPTGTRTWTSGPASSSYLNGASMLFAPAAGGGDRARRQFLPFFGGA